MIEFISSLVIHQLKQITVIVEPLVEPQHHLQRAIDISQAHKTALILTTWPNDTIIDNRK